jgi:NTE family protein
MTGDALRADLVFEGGGVKGIGLAGAFAELYDRGWRAERVAGTSAGAITAALVAAGYDGDRLRTTVLEDMDFRRFADGGLLGALGLLEHKGLHSGDYFLGWMRERLQETGITRFGQLRTADDDTGDPSRRYRLQVIASDVSLARMLVLPRDAALLGIDPDELEIAYAVRMSMSIPVFYVPVVVHDHLIVDGGLLSNFPVWLFDVAAGEAPRWPTFGLLLVAPDQRHPLGEAPPNAGAAVQRLDFVQYLSAIAHTAMDAHDRLYVERADFARTIPIPTGGVGTTQFDISPAAAQALFAAGRAATAEFLATWDFDAYRATFRTDLPVLSRRAAVVAAMHAPAASST